MTTAFVQQKSALDRKPRNQVQFQDQTQNFPPQGNFMQKSSSMPSLSSTIQNNNNTTNSMNLHNPTPNNTQTALPHINKDQDQLQYVQSAALSSHGQLNPLLTRRIFHQKRNSQEYLLKNELPFTSTGYLGKVYKQTPQTSIERMVMRRDIVKMHEEQQQKLLDEGMKILGGELGSLSNNYITENKLNGKERLNKLRNRLTQQNDIKDNQTVQDRDFIKVCTKLERKHSIKLLQGQESKLIQQMEYQLDQEMRGGKNSSQNQQNQKEQIKEVERLDKWKQSHINTNQLSKEYKLRQAVNKKFIQQVEDRTEEMLNMQPELLLRNSMVTTNEILRVPSRQLQSIIKQKQQNGNEFDTLYDVQDGSERLKDILKMKKVTTTGLALQMASKIRYKLNVAINQIEENGSPNDEGSPYPQQPRGDSNSSKNSVQKGSQERKSNQHSSNTRPQTNQQKAFVKQMTNLMKESSMKRGLSIINLRSTLDGKSRGRPGSRSSQIGFEEDESFDEYQFMKRLKNTRQTFSLFVDGDQIQNALREVHQQVYKSENENVQTQPLEKKDYMKFKEIALNYEIALELKSKQLLKVKEEKISVVSKITDQKLAIQNEIINQKNLIANHQRSLEKLMSSIAALKQIQSPNSTPKMSHLDQSLKKSSIALDLISSKLNLDISSQVNKKKIIQDHEENIEQINIYIQELNRKIKDHASEERQFMNEIAFLESEMQHIITKQVNHYHELLMLGLDYRQEGLCWIIKSIWHLGESVNLNKFPKWLDQPAIEFLLDFSRMEISMHNKLKRIHDQQEENKKNRLTNDKIEDFDQTLMKNVKSFHPEDQTNIHSLNRQQVLSQFQEKQRLFLERMHRKLKGLSCNLRKSDLENNLNQQHKDYFMSLLSDDFHQKQNVEDSYFNYQEEESPLDSPAMKSKKQSYQSKYKSIIELESEINFLKDQIKYLREKEQNRILKEFLQNNYERTFKVSIEVVLQALFGFSRSLKVMQKLKQKTDQMKKNLESTKTFQFSNMRSGMGNLLLLDPSLKII
eukprot:403341091